VWPSLIQIDSKEKLSASRWVYVAPEAALRTLDAVDTLFRSEFLKTYTTPLSSDAFTGFGYVCYVFLLYFLTIQHAQFFGA
jgi:hypothetical protein